MKSEVTNLIWQILFWVITGVLGSVCAYLIKQLKNYKKLLKEKDDEHIIKIINTQLETRFQPIRKDIESLKHIDERINKHLKPLEAEIADLQAEIARALENEEQLRIQLIGSYRFRLIQLCKKYITQGYILQEQYDQLSEFFRMYEILGGNGQAKEYYEKATALEIISKIDPMTQKPIIE